MSSSSSSTAAGLAAYTTVSPLSVPSALWLLCLSAVPLCTSVLMALVYSLQLPRGYTYLTLLPHLLVHSLLTSPARLVLMCLLYR